MASNIHLWMWPRHFQKRSLPNLPITNYALNNRSSITIIITIAWWTEVQWISTFLLSDIITDNTTCGYDSGVDCWERPDKPNDIDNLEAATTTEYTNNGMAEYTSDGISVSKFYHSVACSSIKPNISEESNAVPLQEKITSQGNKQVKPTRRKKRRHLLTVRRRKYRYRNIPQSCGQNLGACEQTADAREQTANAREQTVNERELNSSESEMFSEIQGIENSLDALLNSQLHDTSSLEKNTQHEIVNITDHVNGDILHVNDDIFHVNDDILHVNDDVLHVSDDEDSAMNVEDGTNIVSESYHVLFKTNQVNNEEISVDESRLPHSNDVYFWPIMWPLVHITLAVATIMLLRNCVRRRCLKERGKHWIEAHGKNHLLMNRTSTSHNYSLLSLHACDWNNRSWSSLI